MTSDVLDFDRIYAEHRPRIFRYLTRLVGLNDAEDLTQETFIRVSKGLDTFNNEASLSTWIYQIATNVATDRLRSKAFKQDEATIHDSDPDRCPSQPCADKPLSTEDHVIRKEMNECIQSYVGLLPENYRTVLVLSELEGLKNNEIAAILGLSLGTVKIRLHRAKEKLKQELAEGCIFYRTDCNQLACEPKGPAPKKLKPLSLQKR